MAFLTDLPKHVMELMFIIGLGGLVAVIFATNPTDAALGVVALFAAAGYRTLPERRTPPRHVRHHAQQRRRGHRRRP